MIGRVDDYGRALLPLTVLHPQTRSTQDLEAWIDTGFTGALMLTPDQIAQLGLVKLTAVPGGMADGSRASFDAYTCKVAWFGSEATVQALATRGRLALLGVALLENFAVTIDYPARLVRLTPSSVLPPVP